MKWLNGSKIKLILVIFVAAIVLCGGSAKADFTFGEPVNLGPPINTSSGDAVDCFSADGLEMYFDSNRSGGYGGWDIWVTRRPTTDDDWGAPVNLGSPVNTGQHDVCACISADSLELYFESRNRPGVVGGIDIWVTKRATKDDAWGVPMNLGTTINTSGNEGAPWLSTDGLELYFCSVRPNGFGNFDIWVSRRATKDDPWGEPTNLGPIVNSSAFEGFPSLSFDGLVLFFSENIGHPVRSGGFGGADMWVTRRASVSDPWGTPVNLGPIVNSKSHDNGPRISPDGSTLYFSSERPGGFGGTYGDIYQAPIIPIVDFNGDGFIDTEDLLIMIDNWELSETICDIGPMPWGDGVVDIEDLKVFIKYWEEENMPQETEDGE